MHLGKLVSYKPGESGVELFFEEGKAEICFVTDRIVRVYHAVNGRDIPSAAIEELPLKKREFQLFSGMDALTIRGKKLAVRVYDGLQVDFLTNTGQVISEEIAGGDNAGELDEAAAELLAKENHRVAEKAKEHPISVTRALHEGEHIYGLGDKPGFLDKRGYAYEMWNSDIPDPHVDYLPALYKSVPFFLSLRRGCCYGIFFDNTYHSFFDMGKADAGSYTFAADEGNLDYYFIAGESLKEIVGGYTRLTGTTPLPQRWTLGYHQSRWGYKTAEDMRGIARRMREEQIPCDAIHFDIDYMDGYRVFTWNKERYNDPKATLAALAEQGFKPVTIVDPGVKKDEGYAVYEEGVANGYFATDPEGNIYVNEVWPGDAVYPCFTDGSVRAWWGDNQRFLMDMGVRGVWNDMNEPASFRGEIPGDVVFSADGGDRPHREVHNIYGHYMAKATYEGWKRHDGRRPFVITRAAYAGTQKYALVWTGDNQSLWAHLQMAIPQLCNLGLSGFSFAGTDVGGFGADTTKELLARWVQLGCLSPFFRNHSAIGTRQQEPWAFDEELTDIYRKYTQLRYRLLPYLYDCFFEGEQNGMPVMRPLVLNFDKDEETWRCNDEFMVGSWLLAAPVVAQGMERRMVYLPSGAKWYDFWSGEFFNGGQYIMRKAPLGHMPLFVRAGAVIPLAEPGQYVGERETDTLTLAVYPGSGNYIHYQDDGESFAYRDQGFNAYAFSQNNGRLQIRQANRGYEHPYKGFYVKICRGEMTALSEEQGEYLRAD